MPEDSRRQVGGREVQRGPGLDLEIEEVPAQTTIEEMIRRKMQETESPLETKIDGKRVYLEG